MHFLQTFGKLRLATEAAVVTVALNCSLPGAEVVAAHHPVFRRTLLHVKLFAPFE